MRLSPLSKSLCGKFIPCLFFQATGIRTHHRNAANNNPHERSKTLLSCHCPSDNSSVQHIKPSLKREKNTKVHHFSHHFCIFHVHQKVFESIYMLVLITAIHFLHFLDTNRCCRGSSANPSLRRCPHCWGHHSNHNREAVEMKNMS